MTKCIACKKTIPHGMYCNSEAGIDLCQTCSAKIAKHLLNGIITMKEIEWNLAQQVKHIVKYDIERMIRDDK